MSYPNGHTEESRTNPWDDDENDGDDAQANASVNELQEEGSGSRPVPSQRGRGGSRGRGNDTRRRRAPVLSEEDAEEVRSRARRDYQIDPISVNWEYYAHRLHCSAEELQDWVQTVGLEQARESHRIVEDSFRRQKQASQQELRPSTSTSEEMAPVTRNQRNRGSSNRGSSNRGSSNRGSSNRGSSNTIASNRTQANSSPIDPNSTSVNSTTIHSANSNNFNLVDPSTGNLNRTNPPSATSNPANSTNPVQPSNLTIDNLPYYDFLEGPRFLLGNMTPDWSGGLGLHFSLAPIEPGYNEPQVVRTWRELRRQGLAHMEEISPRMLAARDAHLKAVRHGIDAAEERQIRANFEGQYSAAINDYFYWENGVRSWEDFINNASQT